MPHHSQCHIILNAAWRVNAGLYIRFAPDASNTLPEKHFAGRIACNAAGHRENQSGPAEGRIIAR
jgi:hypothetical protein